MKVLVEFEPRDCWFGVFWRSDEVQSLHVGPNVVYRDVWICLVPMLPIHISWKTSRAPEANP